MNYSKLVFIDLETTGANPAIDHITEIGLVEVDQEGQAQHWASLVKPATSIPAFIQGLTGITNEMVQDAPEFSSLAADLFAKLDGALFIAHNARFDHGFLRNAFKAAGYNLRVDVLCTVKLSRALYPEERRHNLDVLIERHGLIANGRHRALADADLIWQFWQKLPAQIADETLQSTLTTLLQTPSLPAHLDQHALDDCPDTPGVYYFYGENKIPLYVGKSVQLRKRVLSHFSADHKFYKEMRLSQQVHHIEWRETAGEIGALLLEAQAIKALQPIHNQQLRQKRSLCAWQLQSDSAPRLVMARDEDFGRAQNLCGLFSSKRKAENVLRELAETHQLCLAMLGLESRSTNTHPCFAMQLNRCKGACVGKEPSALHHARLEAALSSLRIETWPYGGAVGLIEKGANEKTDIHVVNNWCYLGSAQTEDAVWSLLENSPNHPAFDLDTYKILTKALSRRQLSVRKLSS